MKKLLYFTFALALASCGSRQQQTTIVEEEIEYRPLVTDSAAIDSINNSGMVDNDALMEIPDIPKDKSVNMNANDDEIINLISGAGDGDLDKNPDPTR